MYRGIIADVSGMSRHCIDNASRIHRQYIANVDRQYFDIVSTLHLHCTAPQSSPGLVRKARAHVHAAPLDICIAPACVQPSGTHVQPARRHDSTHVRDPGGGTTELVELVLRTQRRLRARSCGALAEFVAPVRSCGGCRLMSCVCVGRSPLALVGASIGVLA